MIKVEAVTLEEAYSNAAAELDCSVTELVTEVVQYPSSGILGLFRKKAIIVATKKRPQVSQEEKEPKTQELTEEPTPAIEPQEQPHQNDTPANTPQQPHQEQEAMQTTFVSEQEDVAEDAKEEEDEEEEVSLAIQTAVEEIQNELSALFSKICFELDGVEVSAYDDNTVYIELNGTDAALLIGKEGYRYKALSYMLFNWINAKYGFGLRLEIAEFLQNQEEAVHRYLENVKEDVDIYGKAQTKILDGVLVQIALRELRATYPDKYVAIRSTRDGLKYIIINDYNNY